MAENESIGGISVDIVGDYSKLQSDIDSAAQVAQEGGQRIAAAFNDGAESADAFDAAIERMVASGSTLAEALAQVSAAEEQVGAASAQAAGEIEPIAASADAAATGLADMGQAAQQAAAESTNAAVAERELSDANAEVASSSHEAAGGIGELGEKFIAFGEALVVVEGLHEFGQEALAASDSITRASISLTALTGSSEKAEETIKGLEQLGISDGLAMPGLLTAATRMTAILGPGTDVNTLLGKLANSAAVMGTNVEAAANSFDRIASAGTLGARQLVQLGLSLDQVAAAMNLITGEGDATAENVGKMFKAMDQADRVEVLSTALDKLGGIAQQVAEQTFGGQWQALSTQWEQIMRDVGDALLPVISGLVDLMKVDILPFIKSMADGFRELPGPVQDVVVGIALLAAAIVPLSLAIGGLGIALDAAAVALAPLVGLMGGFAAVAGVALVSALTGAVLAFHDLKDSMSALNAQEQAMDAQFQKYIAGLAGGAVTQQQVKDAQDKINLALSQGLVSATQAAQGLALLDAAEKKLLGNDVGKMMADFGVSIKLVSDAMTPAAAAAAGMQAKMESLNTAVASARDKMVAASAAYKDGTGSAEDAAKAYATWQAATNALTAAHQAMLPVVQNATVAWRAFVEPVTTYVTAAQAASDAQDALNIELGAASLQLSKMQGNLDQVLQKYRDGAATTQDLEKATDAVATAQSRLNALWKDTPPLVPDFTLAAVSGKQLALVIQEVGANFTIARGPIETASDTLKSVGVNMDDTSTKAAKLITAYQNLATVSDNTLPAEDAMWNAISGSLAKIGQVNMPLVVSLYQQHITDLQKVGASQGEILSNQAKMLQAEISYAQQTGTDATQQVIALNNVKLAQQALADQTVLLGNAYVAIQNDILKGWDDTGKAIADNIIDENAWGQTFINVGKQVAKMILEEIVGTAFKAMKDAIFATTQGVDSMANSFVDLGKEIDKVLGIAVNGAGGAVDAAGKAAGGVGGVAGATGGLLGAVGAISAVVNAISSIIGNFQMARMTTLLGEIEVNTRQTFAELMNIRPDLWTQQGQLLTKLDDLINVEANGLNNIFTRLGDMWTALMTLSAGGGGAGAGGTTPTKVPGLPSAPAIYGGGYTTAPPANPYSNPTATVGASVYSNSTSVNNGAPQIGSLSFTVQAASNPVQTARELANLMKTRVPGGAVFTSQ